MDNNKVLEELVRPKDTFDIEIVTTKEMRRIFMSAGLRNRLTLHIKGLGEIETIFSDPTLQEILLTECLAKRSPEGNVVETVSIDDITIADSEQLIKWIGDHVLYFFINGAMKTGELIQAGSPLQKLMELLNGLHNLLENKQSAGDSTAPVAN